MERIGRAGRSRKSQRRRLWPSLAIWFWFEDVRALGFPLPPWGLAYDSLFAFSWTEGAAGFV
jgi:hypothetical protein